ncbi:MAG: YdeI/OmpD-associated family protein [Pseudomonadota bacterium]
MYYDHSFKATIEKFGVGKTRKIWYNVLFLPDEVQSTLPFEQYPRLRVEGEIADVPIENAFMPTGDGRYYVIVSPKVLRDGVVKLHDRVEMRFRIADQNHVNVPIALGSAIERQPVVQAGWDRLTSGRKRMVAQHVVSAKTDKTRNKRVSEALEAIQHFGGDLRAWRNAKK